MVPPVKLIDISSEILLIILEKIDNNSYINFRTTSLYLNQLSYLTTKYLPLVMKVFFTVPIFSQEKYSICDCSQILINHNPYQNNKIKKNTCIYEYYVHELREIKFFVDQPKKIDCQFSNKKLKFPNQSFFQKFKSDEKKYNLSINHNNNKYLISSTDVNKNTHFSFLRSIQFAIFLRPYYDI